MYALSQDNPPFQISMLQTTGALQLLVDTAREEHSVAGKAKGKGKGKANSDVELADGRPLLTRILICGMVDYNQEYMRVLTLSQVSCAT